MDSASAILWLALAVFNEARSEPVLGQEAVATVILNRTQSECFPNTVRKVIVQRNQFSWVQRGGYLTRQSAERADPEAWRKAYTIAAGTYVRFILNNKSSAQSTHFHTIDTRPAWSSKGKARRRIGNHIFMRLPCGA